MAEKTNNVNQAPLDSEQLSYICKYCGKVNAMSAANCVRCGKRRPRNEYLNAMKRMGASESDAPTAPTAISVAPLTDEEKLKQIDRLVENRVEKEKAQILAQQEVKLDNDREEIKKATARDAVMRIIAAENEAESRIAEAEAKAEAVTIEKSQEIDELLSEEREKALNVAAEKLVAERAAIEEAARERVEANRKANEFESAKQIDEVREQAEKTAARQAVLRIIAAEQAAEDSIRISREAFQQAASERIVEERALADKEAAARYIAEKQAIERAAEERIRAEREVIQRVLKERRDGPMPCYFGQPPVQPVQYVQPQYQPYQQPVVQQPIQHPQQIQPIAIVPYLNQNQPVYQYNNKRVVYKFVPDQKPVAPALNQAPAMVQQPALPAQPKKKKARCCKNISKSGLLTWIFAALVIVIIAVGTMITVKLNITDGKATNGGNISVVTALVLVAGDLFGTSLTLPEMFSEFYIHAENLGYGLAYGMSAAMLVLLVLAIVAVVVGAIRTINGQKKKSDCVVGLLMIVVTAISIVCQFVTASVGMGMETVEALKTVLVTNYGNIILLILSVLVTVCAGIGVQKGKKIKKAKI